jgi:hypothetical protein
MSLALRSLKRVILSGYASLPTPVHLETRSRKTVRILSGKQMTRRLSLPVSPRELLPDSASNAPKIEKFTRKIYGGPKLTWKLHWKEDKFKVSTFDYEANGWLEFQDTFGELRVWDDEKESWKHDVSAVLLSYARLYVFAGKHLIDALRELTLHKLHKYLVALPIYNMTRAAIIDLIIYAYDDNNTPDRTNTTEDGVIDDLRELLVEFIVVHLPAFRDFSGHRELLLRGGDYALDLHDKMLI